MYNLASSCACMYKYIPSEFFLSLQFSELEFDFEIHVIFSWFIPWFVWFPRNVCRGCACSLKVDL